MEGVRVGNRMIGTQSPVTVGWENLPRVEGGPIKRHFFTWFQPAALFALIAFWYYAPNSIATASTAIGIGIGFKALLLALEWVNLGSHPAGSLRPAHGPREWGRIE